MNVYSSVFLRSDFFCFFSSHAPPPHRSSQWTRQRMEKGGCCGSAELMKFFAYTLTDYHRVVHLDTDVLVRTLGGGGDFFPFYFGFPIEAYEDFMYTSKNRTSTGTHKNLHTYL